MADAVQTIQCLTAGYLKLKHGLASVAGVYHFNLPRNVDRYISDSMVMKCAQV